MSFSSDTKKELCKIPLKLDEMIKAEAYGLILFCKKFSEQEISFRTESGDTANRFADIITERTGSIVEIQKFLSTRKSDASLYKVDIPNSDDRKRIISYFGHDNSEVTLRINRANMEFDVCSASFLRGDRHLSPHLPFPRSAWSVARFGESDYCHP